MTAFDDYQAARKKKQEEAKQRAATQNQNRVNEWDNIGKFLGGINKPIGDFFNGLPANQRKVRNEAAKPVPKKATGKGLEVNASMTKGPIRNAVYTEPTEPRYANKQQFDEANYSGPSPEQVKSKSLFDDLLGDVTSDWGGPDKSKVDYGPLDEALNARLGALNKLRETSQGNFNTSDANLESMHRGFQNHIQTEGAGNFNKIADTQKQNLQASNQQSQDYLANIKSQDMAKRNAMLANLGLTEESATSKDVSADPLNEAVASIASRNNADVVNADQDRASNLAYNQGIATSVGQQGVERRSDLAQQLQSILGRIDMGTADAQAENAKARFQLEQNAEDRQYDQWRDNKGFKRDTLGMLQEDARERDKMAMEQQDPREIPGVAGIAVNLRNSGYQDPEIQNAMRILAETTASDEYFRETNSMKGNDKVSLTQRLLQRNGINDPALAFQVAQSLASMGTTSKYEDLPY